MDFVCPTCGKVLPRNLRVIVDHTEEHIINEIKKTHPQWVEENGMCSKCLEYYRKQMHPE